MRRTIFAALAAALFTLCLATSSVADPLPGRDILKFEQRPMINTTLPVGDGFNIFHGHDELSTAWGVTTPGSNFVPLYNGTFMADDFADHFDSPVVHVKWWGSYLNRPTVAPTQQVQKFLVAFESDVPRTAAGAPSHPGNVLSSQIVNISTTGVLTKGSGTFTEKLVQELPPAQGDSIYEYNAELLLDKAFPQKPDTVYWLKIVALDQIAATTVPLDQRLQWGWHNRDYTIKDVLASTNPPVNPGEFIDGQLTNPFVPPINIWHFQDDAVSGNVSVEVSPNLPTMPLNVIQNEMSPRNYTIADGPQEIINHSKDLAFALYTIPEPGTLMLALVACAGGTLVRNRRRR